MKNGSVHNASDDRCLVSKVWQTGNTIERMRGLLGRPALTSNQGIWIEPCPSIHTIGMRYPIDVVFMDKIGTVKKITHHLKPLRFSSCSNARSTLELYAGSAESIGIEEGMTLYWKQTE